jgi:DnaJ family protein C protein 8
VLRIIACFKMNPYEILELDFMPSSTITESEIRESKTISESLLSTDERSHPQIKLIERNRC